MKILQVTAGLQEGGVERGTLEMASYIVAQGGESYVASQYGKLVPSLIQGGSKHIKLPLTKRDPFSVLYCALQLHSIIKSEQIDLVHARSRAPAWAAWIACRLSGAKMITTFHGTHKIQNKFKKFYNSSMVRGERVIAISRFIKQHIVENYSVDEGLIDIAPRGFDGDEFDPEKISAECCRELRAEIGLCDDDFVITLPGRLTRWKGQAVFLNALAQIKDLSWSALIIGGSGGKTVYERELKALCLSLGLQDRVYFLGSQSEIPKYYAISDVIVSASIEPEAFGRVSVEAQAMNKPIIATAHGGSLETVCDGVTGWLYKADSPDALAAKLRLAMNDKSSLKQIGEQGRKWVENHYTVEKMCAAEWGAYSKLFVSFSNPSSES